LIDENRAQGKALGSKQALGRNLPTSIKDAFEVLIEILNSNRTQFMKGVPYIISCSATSHLFSRMSEVAQETVDETRNKFANGIGSHPTGAYALP
jgi:hypothetical protein